MRRELSNLVFHCVATAALVLAIHDADRSYSWLWVVVFMVALDFGKEDRQ